MMHATLALAATAAATTPGGPEPAEAAPCNVSGLWTWGIFEHANEFVVTSTSPERSLFNFTSTNPTPWHTATGVVYSNRTVVLDYGCAVPGCSSVACIYANCSTIVQAGSGPAAARSFVRGSRPTPPKSTPPADFTGELAFLATLSLQYLSGSRIYPSKPAPPAPPGPPRCDAPITAVSPDDGDTDGGHALFSPNVQPGGYSGEFARDYTYGLIGTPWPDDGSVHLQI